MMGWRRWVLWGILATALAVRVAIVLSAGPMTDQDFYGDDAFICHEQAAEIARGRGITQAGLPNNGFQPLFVFLLVPLYWVLDVHQATAASALLNSVLSVAGCLVLFAILRDLFGVRCGLIGAALWASSEYLVRISLNGMETSLANLMMLLVVWLHLRTTRPDARLSALRSAGFGAVLGLAMLARFDLGLLVLPVGLVQVWTRLRRGEGRSLAVMMLAGALVIGPWFAWSYAACGSLTPVSGRASRTISQLFGSATGPQRDPVYFELGEVPAEFYAANATAAATRIVRDTPLGGLMADLAGRQAVFPAFMLGCFAVMAWQASRRRGEADGLPERVRVLWRALWPAWLFALGLVVVYGGYFFAQWHYWRYLSPVAIALMIPSAVVLESVWRWSLSVSRSGAGLLAVVAGLGLAAGGAAHARFFAEPKHGIAWNIYHDTERLAKFVTPGMRLGSFESGTLDYFLPPDVLVFNLDGKTNPAAHRAMVEGRMERIVNELDVEYVVSSPVLIRDLLLRRGTWPPGRLEQAMRLPHNVVLTVNREATAEPPG